MNMRKAAVGPYGFAETLLCDRLDSRAVLISVSPAEAGLLGYSDGVLTGLAADRLYDAASLRRLLAMLSEEGSGGPSAFPVTMLRADGARIELMAIAVRGGTHEQPVLDVFKAPGLDTETAFRGLVESNEILWSIIQKAREAIWCIRFDRPINVKLGVDEIVDQIFEHPAVWCMCNTAMARAYGLRDESSLNDHDVRFHWPRNTVNEAFIREVIANGFQVEGAISEDIRHDGTPVLMENDVRAYIADGKLHRLWGTLREVKSGGFGAQAERADYAALAFELLPMPACLIRSDGTVITENIAWRLAFGPLAHVAARMAFRSAGTGEPREIVLPLPLASGHTQHHLVACRWQSVTEQGAFAAGTAYLTVTARQLETETGAGT